MADFTLPAILSEEFFELLPRQQEVANHYMSSGKLINYAMSVESSKLWAVFSAESEMEVLELLSHFPLMPFMEVEVSPLNAFNFKFEMSEFSLN